MTRYSERYTADRRGALLQILSAAGEPANIIMLRMALEEATPHRPALDAVQADVLWLKQRGAVTVDGDGVAIDSVTLTPRGEDIALGRVRLLGVSVDAGLAGRER